MSLILSDLSHCDELDRAEAQAVRGGHSCYVRENPYPCHPAPQPVCAPPHYNPCQPPVPVHYGCGPVREPVCYPQPGHIVPL